MDGQLWNFLSVKQPDYSFFTQGITFNFIYFRFPIYRYLVYSKLELTVDGSEEIIPINMAEEPENEYIRISTDTDLETGLNYKLTSEYIGFLKPNNFGLYISNYLDEEGRTHYVGSTQMEGPYARRTFPCLDEPPYKATFSTILYNEVSYPWSDQDNEYYTISNMEVDKDETIEGWRKTEFKVGQ